MQGRIERSFTPSFLNSKSKKGTGKGKKRTRQAAGSGGIARRDKIDDIVDRAQRGD